MHILMTQLVLLVKAGQVCCRSAERQHQYRVASRASDRDREENSARVQGGGVREAEHTSTKLQKKKHVKYLI